MGISLKSCFALCMLGILCAAGSASAQPASAQQPAAQAPRKMSDEEAKAFAHVMGMVKPGQPYRLNLADPQQLAFTQLALATAGRTASTAPQTLSSVNAAAVRSKKQLRGTRSVDMLAQPMVATVAGGPQDIEIISNFGSEGSNVYTATGYSSVIGGTTQTTITMQLVDTASNIVYATNTNAQYAGGTDFSVSVTGQLPANANVAAVATFVTSQGDTSNTTLVTTAKMVPASTGTMTAPNYCVRTNQSDPNSSCVLNSDGTTQYLTGSTTLVPNPQPIKICFQRGSAQSCDYYNNTLRPASTVFFPSAGTAVFGSNTVGDSYATEGRFTATINDPVGGGGCVFSNNAPLGTGWSVSADKSTLQWNLTQLSMVDPSSCTRYTGGRPMNYMFYIETPLQTASGSNTGFLSFSSAYSPPMAPGNLGIPGIFLEDSCLAAGTLVQLADGQQVPVESITADNQPKIRTATGDVRTVLGTASGVELRPMVRLKTSSGHDLLITGTHPVLTTKGLVMSRDVRVGDVVRTDKGEARIVSATTEEYTGKVYSLRLGWFDEARSDGRTHTAGGIFVGDSISQWQMERDELQRLKADKAEVERRLPDDKWRAEYRRFIGK